MGNSPIDTLIRLSPVLSVMNRVDQRIQFTVAGSTLRVRDVLEDAMLPIETDREIDPASALTALFPFPVDRAVSLETTQLSLPSAVRIAVRDADGDRLANLVEPMTFDSGTYCLEITGPTKLYLRVADVGLTADGVRGTDPVRIEFEERTRVAIGARSIHSRPEATVTVPDDPDALATGVSALASSIKEFSPEQSWPTLRGYPPRIERGEELHVPQLLDVPDTGVRLTVPSTYADVYRVTPLAYYLGATLETGGEPAIHLDTGYTEPLPTGSALGERIEDLLGRCMFLDSLCRMDGYVPSDRHEYERIGSKLPFYPPAIAELSTDERLMEFLEVERDSIAQFLPSWPVRATLQPVPAAATLLPHLAYVLAPIRIRDATRTGPVAVSRSLGISPIRPPSIDSDRPAHGPVDSDQLAQSPVESDRDFAGSSTDALTEPFQPGRAALRPTSYENRFERSLGTQGAARVVIIADGTSRADQLREVIGTPRSPDGIDSLRFVAEPSASEFRSLVGDSDVDIAYCELPIVESGIECHDGVVDPGSLPAAPAAVVLGGEYPGSYTATTREGRAGLGPADGFIDAGSLAAANVVPAPLPADLRRLVGLLAVGMTVGPALRLSGIAEGGEVRLVGDPSLTAVMPKQGILKSILTVRSIAEDEHHITRRTYPSIKTRLGSEARDNTELASERPELAGTIRTDYARADTAAVLDLISEFDTVVRLNGTVVFDADDLTAADVERSARLTLGDRIEKRDFS